MKDMYQFLSVLMCSHTTGLSIEKSVEVLQRFGSIAPALERVRWIPDNVFASSTIGRRVDMEKVWSSHWDTTHHLT